MNKEEKNFLWIYPTGYIPLDGNILITIECQLKNSFYSFPTIEMTIYELKEFIEQKDYVEKYLMKIDNELIEIIYKKENEKINFYYIIDSEEYLINNELNKDTIYELIEEIRKKIKIRDQKCNINEKLFNNVINVIEENL